MLLWLCPYSGATNCKTCLDKQNDVGRQGEAGGRGEGCDGVRGDNEMGSQR